MKVSELMNPKGVLLYAKIDNSADALGILVELQEGIGVITNRASRRCCCAAVSTGAHRTGNLWILCS